MRSINRYSALGLLVAAMMLCGAPGGDKSLQAQTGIGVRFIALDVFIDSGTNALAAYQFEFLDPTHQLEIVGVEGGEHAAFKSPPYYDTRALQEDRIIIAAFNTGADLPTGKTRVATLHVQVPNGDLLNYEIKLDVAASEAAERSAATITYETRK